MKKKVSFLLIVLTFLIGLQLSFANSGPTFWQGYPSSEVLTIDKNCPIGVEEEKLVFDLSNGRTQGHTINGVVTASYKMVNPTDNDVSVQMAFPFVSKLNDFSQDDIVIESDGSVLPYDLYIGKVVNSDGNTRQQENNERFAFTDIVSNITNTKTLDEMFTSNKGVGSYYELMEQNRYERIMTMVYTVDFPANSSRDVSVSYRATGTMDKTKTEKPVYTFDYLLNPAKNWSSFRNLTIEVITPEEAPYVVDSSIKLVKEKDRYYTASFDTLPDKDLVFSLYSDERITYSDKSDDYIFMTLILIVVYLIPFIVISLTVLAVIALIRRVI